MAIQGPMASARSRAYSASFLQLPTGAEVGHLRQQKCSAARPRMAGALAELGGRARSGPDVIGRRADQPALALLLEDVGRPAGHTRAREHRREEGRRYA